MCPENKHAFNYLFNDTIFQDSGKIILPLTLSQLHYFLHFTMALGFKLYVVSIRHLTLYNFVPKKLVESDVPPLLIHTFDGIMNFKQRKPDTTCESVLLSE